MTKSQLKTPAPFIASSKKTTVKIIPLKAKSFKSWKKKQDAALKAQIDQAGFSAQSGRFLFHYSSGGHLESILLGLSAKVSYYDIAPMVKEITARLSSSALKDLVFKVEQDNISADELLLLCVGWGWSCYSFDSYKKTKKGYPILVWPKGVDKAKAEGLVHSVCLIRNLVNTPANDMGPKELTAAARSVAKEGGAKIKVISDKDLKTDFPLVFTVGDSSERRPCLVDFVWGKETDPKVTLVGKGVCFDTGGLDLKPPRFMLQMKKDMGGAAHVLGLAALIMKTKLPIRLRVLIPAVENAVSGRAFRPRDVVKSRIGQTVELSDTDAEGRLILADAITLASEENPDLIMDFATLTGSARSALGYEIPACFTNNDKIAGDLKKISYEEEDQVWPLPLWKPYLKELNSDIADINNIGAGLGGAIHGGLFLETFLRDPKIDWVHLDIFSWEMSGKPGRTKGGADTGMRAAYAYLEKRFGKTKKTKKK